jgi:hypothetical protein
VFCSQCGASNPDNGVICTQCGQSLNAPAPIKPSAVFPPGSSVPGSPGGVNVPNHLVFAILVTVLCCLPTGIAAIVYAAQVNGKLQAGDIAGAQEASKNAKMWCWISVGAGLVIMLGYCVVGLLSFMNHR